MTDSWHTTVAAEVGSNYAKRGDCLLERNYRGLYIHVPFCSKRCAYCDFTTRAISADSPELDAYSVDSFDRGDSVNATREGLLGSIQTIYIGGGTPSYFGHSRLVELAYTISLSINLDDNSEFTIEANPDSLSGAMVRDLFALGVNRFSLGVQSFVDSELEWLGRSHDSQQALDAICLIQERCDNVAIDLICGIPARASSAGNKISNEPSKPVSVISASTL